MSNIFASNIFLVYFYPYVNLAKSGILLSGLYYHDYNDSFALYSYLLYSGYIKSNKMFHHN